MTIEEQVEELSHEWRNFLCNQMGLNKKTFQLAQGSLNLLGADDFELYLLADSIPSEGAIEYFDASTLNKRSDAYGELLQSLLPEVDTDRFKRIMGRQYEQWKQWQNNNKPKPRESYLSYFKRWAKKNLDPATDTKAEIQILKSNNASIRSALYNFFYYKDKYQKKFYRDGFEISLYNYSVSITQVKKAINSGTSLQKINFTSDSSNKKSNRKNINNNTNGLNSVFSSASRRDYSKINNNATSGGFTITGNIGKYATLPCSPVGWYNSALVNAAAKSKGNNKLWDDTASSNWDTFFNKQTGSLNRYISQFVLVSDYDITITSHAKYKKSEVNKIQSDQKISTWPFFIHTEPTNYTTKYTHNKDGSLSINHKLNKGLIQIWGVNVQNI